MSAGSAAILSWIYLHHYLGGGPRIIDATSYWLEARSFADGAVGFAVPDPGAAFRGRFLVQEPSGDRLGVIFPPGYPLFLAGFMLLGIPLLSGPFLAAALVVATFALAERSLGNSRVARAAAVLSVCCAALRYHTADTMSHGWAALLFATAVWSALGDGRGSWVLSGLASGWLVATRPVTGCVALSLCLWKVAHRSGAKPGQALAAYVAGAAPLVLVFLWHQHALTGAWFHSSQAAYYAASDGPLGCFRYGFGAGIGCRFEHGDFIDRYMPHGFGLSEALGTTWRRFSFHLRDAGNSELLLIPWGVAALRGGCDPRARWLALPPLLLALAYAPFYFDGNYPGGGARLYADALPFEHMAIAWGCAQLRMERWVPIFAMAGFALRTEPGHRALAQREGGRPMFERSVLDAAGVTRGLVLVNTDHGFNLGHEPNSRDALAHTVVARYRGDSFDRMLWNTLGRPKTYLYEYNALDALIPPSLREFPFEQNPPPWRFEGESQWPLPALRSGTAYPVDLRPVCASARRGLRLNPDPRGAMQARIEIMVEKDGTYRVGASWVGTDLPSRVALSAPALRAEAPDPTPATGVAWATAGHDGCRHVETTAAFTLQGGRAYGIWLAVDGGEAVLDAVQINPAGSPDVRPPSITKKR